MNYMNFNKKLAFALASILLNSYLSDKPVSLQDAQNVALNWMSRHSAAPIGIKSNANLLSNSGAMYKDPAFHASTYRIIQLKPHGWVIVSSDDIATPIIAYGTSDIDPSSIPPGFALWMQEIDKQITSAIQSSKVKPGLTQTLNTGLHRYAAQWDTLRSKPSDPQPKLLGSAGSQNLTSSSGNNYLYPYIVRPLLWLDPDGNSTDENQGIRWSQTKYYNDKVPEYNDYNKTMKEYFGNHYPVGCVATAMGQVLAYYSHKQQIITTGYHDYVDNGTSDLRGSGKYMEAYFENGYTWNKMPDKLDANSSHNEVDAVSHLLADLGVSVEMIYTPIGSNSIYYDNDNPKSPSALNALKTYFGFHRVAYAEKTEGAYEQYQTDRTYSSRQWSKLIITSLKAGDPILFGGLDKYHGGGHAFVLDGYQDRDGYAYFHFNWGWDGLLNGNFKLDDIAPNSKNDFGFMQRAVLPNGLHGVEPDDMNSGYTQNSGLNSEEDNFGGSSVPTSPVTVIIFSLLTIIIVRKNSTLFMP
jgi:hypothetical protein